MSVSKCNCGFGGNPNMFTHAGNCVVSMSRMNTPPSPPTATPTDQCRCTMISEQTLEEPSDWEQADDCPVHPLTTPTDPTWLTTAVEAGARALLVLHEMSRDWESLDEGDRDMYRTLARAAILAALPEITGGIAEVVDDYADAVIDLIDSQNSARLAFEKIGDDIHNFGSEVTR